MIPTHFAFSTTAVIAFVIIYFFFKNGRKKKRQSSPPIAPTGWFETTKKVGHPKVPWFFIDMARKTASNIYKIRLPMPGGVYVVGDASAMREILLDKASNKPASVYQPFADLSGHANILTRSTLDPIVKAVRKGIAPAFSSKEIRRMNSICTRHVQQWMQSTLDPLIEKNGGLFDPSIEMIAMTFNAIMESAFEYHPSEEERDAFLHNLEETLREFCLKRLANPFRKHVGFLIPESIDAVKSSLKVQAFAQKVLDAYRANENKSQEKTVIKLIVENKTYTTDKERVADIVVMMIGGFDTTGYTLSTILVLLAKHPRVSEKLRQELMTMDSTDWSKSDYLKCVINESKRLLPVAAIGSIRTTSRDFVFNNGSIVIPKGAVAFMPFILPLRDPLIFEDPDSFHPERWETASKAMREAYFVFSLGNRNCPGQSLAVAELYSSVPRLIAKYKFEVETEGELEHFLTLKHVGTRLKASLVIA